MRRTTPLTAAGLLGLALLAPAYSAGAAGETCRGEAATIVGTAPTLTGTEGRDVIVTGIATSVDALAGDDLVCVTGGGNTHVLDVKAGYGNDVVDTTTLGSGFSVAVDLGAGADVLDGGAAAEAVTGGFAFSGGIDEDKDTVRTGAGDDRAIVGAGYSGAGDPPADPNADDIDMGADDDVATVARTYLMSGIRLTGGTGTDQIAVDFTTEGTALIDMAAGLVRTASPREETIFVFSSFETADVSTGWPGGSGHWGPDSVEVRGTAGDDVVTMRPDQTASNPDVSVRTYGGDDQVVFSETPTSNTRVDTGTGTDLLVAAGPNGSMRLDLAKGTWRSERFFGADPAYWPEYPEVVNSVVDNVEDAFLMAPDVTIVGSARSNDLAFYGCSGALRGGAGGDRLSVAATPRWDGVSYDCEALALAGTSNLSGGPGQDRLRGGGAQDELRGDGGADRLEGRGGSDVLLGGRGKDKADGGKRRDRCVAEWERRCER